MNLADGEIHLWRSPLRCPQNVLTDYWALLSDDEIERAGRFKFDVHRNSFVVSRGILRKLLKEYLPDLPDKFAFSYGAQGKPELPGMPLHFNISHSAELALLAFTRIAPVGVDIEQVRDLDDLPEIAKRFFSQAEVNALRPYSQHYATRAFFRCWTRKEAFIKAVGEGLSYPLDRFSVSLEEERAELLSVATDAREAANWLLFHLTPQPGYVGALAIRSRNCKLVPM